MTAITDATTVIETIIGRTLTGEQLGYVGETLWFAGAYGDRVAADPENPTNEEMAQFILDDTLAYWKTRLIEKGKMDNNVDLEAAIATAKANLE